MDYCKDFSKEGIYNYIKELLKRGHSEEYIEAIIWTLKSFHNLSLDDINLLIEKAKKEAQKWER